MIFNVVISYMSIWLKTLMKKYVWIWYWQINFKPTCYLFLLLEKSQILLF
jgi:hypothetical protein